ncbi:MAG: hypothetical protein RJA70_355 [Pseudomonadota bacterium]
MKLEGARTHNLKGVTLTFQPGELCCITGVSGAGKSSLALDTLYAEGQRRFVESFSPYARQFLERLERPPMDRLEPVPAGVAIDRAAPVKSSRSTVATMADIEPLMAALFVRESWPVCPEHGQPAVSHDTSSATQRLLDAHRGERALVSYRVPVHGPEHYLTVRDQLTVDGFRRLWLEQGAREIDGVKPSEIGAHVDVVVDRVRIEPESSARLSAAFELAWARGDGQAQVHLPEAAAESTRLNQGLACPTCARRLERPSQGLFSYDSPLGACSQCRGFGRVIGIDLDKVVPDPYKSLAKRAIRPWNGKSTTWERGQLKQLCARHGIPMDVPWIELTEAQRALVLQGDGDWKTGFPGVLGWFQWMETRTYKMHVRVLLARYRAYDPCPKCRGSRFGEAALSYHVAGTDIGAWHRMEVAELSDVLLGLETQTAQGALIRDQLRSRVGYLARVGLGYLSLDRQARTLSGGESQRVTLTAALGTSLCNALFVLDEPSVGLHPSDIPPLIDAARELASRNNIVLIVEHDPLLIWAADRVVELGPAAGAHGGHVVFDGTPQAAMKSDCATARALAEDPPPGPEAVRVPSQFLRLHGVQAHNIEHLDLDVPLGVLTVVSGPSGSGKSSLVESVLYRALARRLGNYDVERPAGDVELSGTETLSDVVLVDQSPLGRTSRGNTATYTKAWDHIRKLFSEQPAAKRLKFGPSHFSFNVDGGRCSTCKGEGYETVEMQFLADVSLVCPVCKGRRFREEVLAVNLRGVSVDRMLSSTVDQVLELFPDVPQVQRALGPVRRLGLGYMALGQPLSTLSGGEAQRLKLARALSERLRGTLFIVDEPSAGLHRDEVNRVLECFDQIVDAGGSVVCVEHDLAVVSRADWVIDMGPGAGKHGGRVVFEGPPNALRLAQTRTGIALAGLGKSAPTKKQKVAQRPQRTGSKVPVLAVVNAREHNLKDVSTQIPHGALTVVTGPSGSGKSSLVFDVIFAEGQRRFLETLTPYARRFLPTLPKPDVDSVSGVPPSIALEQRTSRAGTNSTVATVTEVAHYLRLLFAKLGTPHCPLHDEPIGTSHPNELLQRLQERTGLWALLAPVVEARKGTYLDVFNAADRDGITEAIADGQQVDTRSPPKLVRSKEHTIDLVVRGAGSLDQLTLSELERALTWGNGSVKLCRFKRAEAALDPEHYLSAERYSTRSACPVCGFSVPELDPRWFSFNTEQGRCATCEGSGTMVMQAAPRKKRRRVAKAKASETKAAKEAAEPAVAIACPSCDGARLAPIPRAVRVAGVHYHAITARSVAGFSEWIRSLSFQGREALLSEPILVELRRRVEFLEEVGLVYLSLDRMARSLSGGEMQRLRLAAQLGAGLTGALYVLDEPTIGLHPRDTARLIQNMKKLVALGSTLIVVEHDADTIRAADYLVDMGPQGGALGGCVIAAGEPKSVLASDSPTALTFRSPPPIRVARKLPARLPKGEILGVYGVTQHNLQRVNLELPLGAFNVVAGVSGSGKSTLIRSVLLPAVRRQLGLATADPGSFESLSSLGPLKRAISVDQSPIGRTPRSVPATFLGIWDDLRKLFASSTDAMVAGYGPSRFSFNTPAGGRCTTCDGQGVLTHEMSFLPDTVQQCPACLGLRFEPETLRIRYAGASIGEVLRMSAEEAVEAFRNHPKLTRPLETLVQLGAGYIQLGQGSHTLSGGEAQRLKLAAELTATARHEPTLYVLDEPTTGLHQADVGKLVSVLGRLVERGDTLVVIEHHPFVIAGADYLVELGPEGGQGGGRVVAEGAPHAFKKKKTATALAIAELL